MELRKKQQSKKQQQKNNMKAAVVDQILLWMVIFIAFVTLLFITVDYSALIRLKSNNDSLAKQGARMVALGRTIDETADSLNNIRNNYYSAITAADISCIDVVATDYQVIFNVISTYTDTTVITFTNNIHAKTATFNEVTANEITCTLNLSNN